MLVANACLILQHLPPERDGRAAEIIIFASGIFMEKQTLSRADQTVMRSLSLIISYSHNGSASGEL